MKNLQVTYELKIQVLENNQTKFNTKGDLENLKVNLNSLNKSKRKSMRTEISNSIKPLQDTIFLKESSPVKKLTKDEIITELRAENAQLRAENAELKKMVLMLTEEVKKISKEFSDLKNDYNNLKVDYDNLKVDYSDLQIKFNALNK